MSAEHKAGGRRPKELTGQRFGKLVVTTRAPSDGARVRWNVQCDCGGTAVAYASSLLQGMKKSCGCARKAAKFLIANMHEKQAHATARSVKCKSLDDVWNDVRGAWETSLARYLAIGLANDDDEREAA